ncbi:MAG: hypothetical protein IJU37_07350 [Desulfovibrio sp.]|nr:hypothetical protein [Desulfovibrio sp.]
MLPSSILHGLSSCVFLGTLCFLNLNVCLGATLLAADFAFSPQSSDEDKHPASRNAALPLEISASASCPLACPSPRPVRACAAALARLKVLALAVNTLPDTWDWRAGLPDTLDRRVCILLLCTLADAVAEGQGQRVTVTLRPRPKAKVDIVWLLRHPEALTLQEQLLQEMEARLGDLIKIARRDDGPRRTFGWGGTWHRATVPSKANEPSDAATIVADELEQAASRLEAVMAIQDVLHPVAEGWLVRPNALSALQHAVHVLPEQALFWLLLAEAQLQVGLPQGCVDSSSRAVQLAPTLQRARYIRALALWRLQQLALAEVDLDAELDLLQEADRSTRAARLRTRGAVRMLRRNEAGMCADFFAACALGDCEGLSLVRKNQQCLEAEPR